MTEMLTCELCHSLSIDVRPGLAWYRGTAAMRNPENPFSVPSDPVPEQVQTIDRCQDHVACRRRVEQRGDRWPLLDRTEIAA